MKTILYILIFIIPFTVLAKPSSVDSLVRRIERLEKSVISYSKFNDSIVKTNTTLVKEADYSERLLSKYDTLNNNVFAIIGIVFTFLSIVVPLIGYFTVVIPAKEKAKEAQDLLDNIKSNMDKLFLEYTLNNRDKLIENSLSQMENNITSQKSNAINCLDSYKHEGFNERQIMRMIILIKKDNRPDFFMTLLCFTENIFATDFLHEYLKKNPTNHLSTWACIYAAKYNKDEFLDDIAEYIIQSKNITGILASVHSSSQSYLEKIYNNDKLVKGIDSENLIQHMSFFDNYDEHETPSEKEARQNSNLYKKYLEIKPA